MSDPYIGQIYLVGYAFAQRGFALCEGQLIAISQNTALFSLIGTQFGGNGTQTFALPDLRGRVAIGQGSGINVSPRTIGQMGGSETTTLSTANLPSHTHSAALMAEDTPASASTPSGNLMAQANIYAPAGRGADVALNTASVTVGATGGNQPAQTMPPFLVLNYEIALQGIFPSRS